MGLPRLAHGKPSNRTLDKLCAGYTAITGDPVFSEAKRNLVAVTYRVHGTNFLPLVQRYFDAAGHCINLLGDLRTTEREDHWARALPAEGV